jgi:hypothetical protein
LWASVDLRPGGCRLMGIAGQAGFYCATLTSGIRGEPVNVSGGSHR